MGLKTQFVLFSVLLFMVWENVIPFFTFKQQILKSYLVNTAWALLNIMIATVTVSIVYTASFGIENLIISDQITSNPWYGICGFLLLDVYIYCWHRFIAHSEFGFIFHRTHHSDTEMNSLSAYRFNTVEVIVSQMLRLPLIVFFSIPLEVFLFHEIVFSLCNIMQHSNIGLPNKIDQLLSYVFVTPNLHKIHHSVEKGDSHTNFSTVLSIWDRVFGSFRSYPIDRNVFRFGIGKY